MKHGIDSLRECVISERERIVRLWAKAIRNELGEIDSSDAALRAPLAERIDELARLLSDRGEEALRLWPEAIRPHGALRYDQRFGADDVAREFKLLQETLLRVYARKYGELGIEVVELIAELCGEATAAMEAAYARVLRTEDRFKEAEVMESILENVDTGFLVVERDGGISYVTPAVARLTGLPARTMIGEPAVMARALATLKARHPDGRPWRGNDMPYMHALREQRTVHGEWMVISRHPGGEEALLELTATPIWSDESEGELVGVIQALSDRTETARKERELSRAYDELRRLQNRLLQRTRSQALGQLASGAAHALNNFLNVIRLRVRLLRREFKVDHLDALDRSVMNIGELVARLQEYSTDSSEEELAVADVDAVLNEAIELARVDLSHAERPVVVDARLDAAQKARLDETLLRELVVNLLMAARDRMPSGGKIEVRSSSEDGAVSISIEDDGRPYSPAELTALFDPLKAPREAPLSLLLAVGRTQVQRWGGELGCENCDQREKGAMFRIRLPIAQELSQEKPVSTPSALQKTQAQRVLVVDDDVETARMMAEVLEDEGYDVKIGHNARDALELWQAEHYDAALLDAVMPDKSGWELARELRGKSPRALIAMVTGTDVRGQNRDTLALVDAVFRKPIDMGALDEFLSQSPRPAPAEGEPMPPLH